MQQTKQHPISNLPAYNNQLRRINMCLDEKDCELNRVVKRRQL